MELKREKKSSPPSPDFPFESRFVSVGGYRIHYVEQGRGDPVLFIHGNPTSSYVWRNILPKVARDAGRRGIALDLLGFGKSDKPKEVTYTVRLHYNILSGFIEKLGLRNLLLVLHDWGGPLGASYAVNHPETVQGIALMETFLWNMTWKDFGKWQAGFRLLRSPLGFSLNQVMNVFVERLLPKAFARKDRLSEEVVRRYREPFPTIRSRRAVRAFPRLLPVEGRPAESAAFFDELERKLPGLKCSVLWIKDAPEAVNTKVMERRLHGLQAMLPQLIIKDFGPGLHCPQEDDPEKTAELITQWMRQCGRAAWEAASPERRRAA
jgi:haloalkane dehalogenase